MRLNTSTQITILLSFILSSNSLLFMNSRRNLIVIENVSVHDCRSRSMWFILILVRVSSTALCLDATWAVASAWSILSSLFQSNSLSSFSGITLTTGAIWFYASIISWGNQFLRWWNWSLKLIFKNAVRVWLSVRNTRWIVVQADWVLEGGRVKHFLLFELI